MALAVESAAPVPTPQPPAAASSLAPGFRFHPTDEELVRYYLRRKVCGKPFRFDAISDVDVYKVEPWDLPDLSRLKTRDLEWYFFSVLDKKYGNGSRTNRATEKGYWKTTGKDRNVYHRSQMVGMKKTLVYHSGRAPKGERTNWVMHEYRLIDQELEKVGIAQDAFVLCRIFRKSGSGPKNGEQYGAPFVEEEWDDDDLVMVPKQESAEELPDDDDAYLDINDLALILGPDMPEEDGPHPVDSYHGDNVNCVDVQPIAMINDPQQFLDGVGEDEPEADNIDRPKLFDLPVQDGADPTVKREYIGEPSNPVNFDVDYLLDEPFFDATTGDLQFDETSFFDANDLENAVKTDPGLDMFDEYTSFLNPGVDNFDYTFDSIGSENILADSSLTQNIDQGSHQGSEKSQLFDAQDNNVASSSKQVHPNIATDYSYPFLKKASCMLGSISAPPAFASEFPTKYLDSASQSSSSVHVTAGMIRLRNVSFSGSEVDWSLSKPGQVNIVLSFGLGQSEVNPVNPHQISLNSEKVENSAVTRSWFYCLFLWILVLSMSYKIGSFICPRSFMS